MKLGIRSKLVAVSVGLIAGSVLAADTYLTTSLDADLVGRVESDLFVRAALVEREVSATPAGADDLARWDEVADALAERAEGRVTILRADGAVLGDSELDGEGLASAERHGDRTEVKAALTQGRGAATRLSSTVGERMMYVALPFDADAGVSGVVRVAVPLTEVDASIARLRRIVYAASGLGLLASVVMSMLAAHFMSRTVRSVNDVARRLAAGDLTARTRVAGHDEVAELGRSLDRLASSLSTALAELRSERDLLGCVLDGMREGVLLVDRNGRVALTNPALREMLLVGANVSGKLPLELVRSAELKQLLDEVATSGRTAVAEIDVGDLKPRRLLVHATPLAEVGGTLAVFVDVTDIRRLESMRRDFVANVSHELRTPVATVLSAAETLHGSGLTQAAGVEFVEIIERNAERLRRLVEDLLELSRIEARELELDPERVDVKLAVDQALSLFGERIRHKRLSVSIAIDADAHVRADPRALEQILVNLIDNAVKYTSDGAAITVRSARCGSTVRLEVVDTGPGIEEKHLPRLFERFYRADAGRSRDVGGTGLGLSIVKNLAEAMGGTVDAESPPAGGAIFSVSLPYAPGDGASAVERPATA